MPFEYKDEYLDQSVFVADPAGHIVSTVPPWYCATIAGATAMQANLATLGVTVTISLDWPQIPAWTWFSQSKKVPYLDDGKGAHERAGDLIYNYKNLPASLADTVAKEAFTLDDTAGA